MLDYLEQLIKEGQWEEALILAEQLVQNTSNTVEDMVRINLALISARAFVGECSGVVTLGDHAAGMAADVGNWGAFLTICHFVAVSHARLHQWAFAKKFWLDYVENLQRFGGHHAYEIITWFHLGLASTMEKELESAVYYYEKSREISLLRGTKRQLLGVNQALISAYMRIGKNDRIPRLLAQTLHYLRNNPGADEWFRARIMHFKVRAEFALATYRFERARLVALRGLNLSEKYPEYRHHMHMILANVAKEKKDYDQMVAHLTSARVAAIRARRYDYEVDAAESLYQLLQENPQVLDTGSKGTTDIGDLPMSWFEIEEVKRPGRP